MFSRKLFLTIFLVFFLVVSSPIEIFAIDSSIPKSSINPDSYLLYSFKRLFEKGFLYIKFNPNSKLSYYQGLVAERISELNYIVENKLIGEVEHSTQRLSYQVSILADYVSNESKLEDKRKNIYDFLDSYKELLGNLRDNYPANSSYWMLVQHSINTIDSNLEKLK